MTARHYGIRSQGQGAVRGKRDPRHKSAISRL